MMLNGCVFDRARTQRAAQPAKKRAPGCDGRFSYGCDGFLKVCFILGWFYYNLVQFEDCWDPMLSRLTLCVALSEGTPQSRTEVQQIIDV